MKFAMDVSGALSAFKGRDIPLKSSRSINNNRNNGEYLADEYAVLSLGLKRYSKDMLSMPTLDSGQSSGKRRSV